MNEIVEFFTAPYATASMLNICLELLAVILGILSVWFAKNEHILVFPTGIKVVNYNNSTRWGRCFLGLRFGNRGSSVRNIPIARLESRIIPKPLYFQYFQV